MSLIGKSPVRPDAFDKVTGGKDFPVNIKVPRMLHGKLLRSPYPHARIISIDTSAAEKLPGVKAVLVPAEVPTRKFTPVYFVPANAVSMPLRLSTSFVVFWNTFRACAARSAACSGLM